MIFSEIFIRRPITTVLIMMAILIFGTVAFFKLPISDLPSVDYPVMTISVYYPGASPQTMASTVASPLEDQCMDIQGLHSIISSNTEGNTQITLTFDLDRNVDLAAPDVQAAISRAIPNLPSDLPQQPAYTKNNPSDKPIFYLQVSSDTMPSGDLYDFGNRLIAKRLSMLSGVSNVAVYGAMTAVRIQVDSKKIASFGIGLNEIAKALQNGTVTIPGGSLNGKYRTFSIEPKGQLLKASDYEKLIVAYRNDAPVYLGDIATCVDSLENDLVEVIYNDPEKKTQFGSVTVAVTRSSGANTVAVVKEIMNTIDELKDEIPGSVHLDVFYDKSKNIIASIDDVKTTIVIALILVVTVIFLFLGRISDTIIPSIVLPLSLVGTFILMLGAGFSLDNLSLMGLTLCVGFLVDDAIVVLENTVRHVQEGKRPFQAAILSMKEITFTVISTSIALVTVFVPLIFMTGVVGRNFHEFALTVTFAIIFSTIMALTLTPMMCARMLKPLKEGKTKLEKFSDRFIGFIRNKYAILLRWVLKHKFITLLGWLLCILGSLWLFKILPKTFLPLGDSGAIFGQMVAQQGTSTDQIRTFQKTVNRILLANPNIEQSFSITGRYSGADQSTGMLIIILKSQNKRKPIETVVQELNKTFAMLPYGFVFIEAMPSLMLSSGGESTAMGSMYSYVLTGEDRDTVYECATALESKMKAMPEIVGVQTSVKLNMPQLNVTLLRDRASALGITAADIENVLSLAYAGGKVTTYKTDIDQYDVIVELEKKYQRRPENLSTIYILSAVTGDLIPLGSVSTWEETVGPQNVPHDNQMNSATLSFNLASGVPLGTATQALNAAAAEVLKSGVAGQFQGQAQEFEQSVKSLSLLLLVAIFVMYIILGILYESYIHPFTVLSTLPPAVIGGLATLLFFNSEISLYAYIGMFMLLGIVSKNGIMMVDFAKQNMAEGKNGFDAIYDACLVRFRPILMTGLSTIMGAIPIALGFGADGASRRPLGLIVVGGLIFAQGVTLLITPGIFLYMQKFQEKVLDKFELTRSGAAKDAADLAEQKE